MKVKLIAYTPNPDKLVYMAAKQTISNKVIEETSVSEDQIRTFLRKLHNLGHNSVFEHVSFTFLISGISRACSHQLVRHRLASYSQLSQRRTGIVSTTSSEINVVLPQTIMDNREAHAVFDGITGESFRAYRRLEELGIPKEDARYVLPEGTTTILYMTMNGRELLHVIKLRTDESAQWEIRELFTKMEEEVKRVAPAIFSVLDLEAALSS
jgi:thymidylate synthase (FAD)